jgi:hypothetical protein
MSKRLVLIITLLSTPIAYAQHTKWWRGLTPNQQRAIDCEVAKDDESLARLLRPLGWGADRFPDNDWSTRYVVVIAPNLFHRGYHLGFIEERKSDTTLEFRWSWVTPEASANGTQNGGSVSIGEAH